MPHHPIPLAAIDAALAEAEWATNVWADAAARALAAGDELDGGRLAAAEAAAIAAGRRLHLLILALGDVVTEEARDAA